MVFNSPGVYRRETVPVPVVRLQTGVPGFVGFAAPAGGDAVVLLTRAEDIVALNIANPDTSYLAAALSGFFANGGSRCLVAVANRNLRDGPVAALSAALDQLGLREDIDLIALPDAMDATLVSAVSALQLQQQALSQCALLGNRIAILDALPDLAPLPSLPFPLLPDPAATVYGQGRYLTQGLGDIVNGALYYPWIALETERFVPPCGHIAGIIAATDAAVGVFKAPANVGVAQVVDLQNLIDNDQQGPLNDAGVNCLRALPGRGIRVWGARTLSRNPQWRYLSVRRLFLTMSRWIDLTLGWVAFEPNAPTLWARIERDLTAYLDDLWKAGALVGDRAEQAYFVRCAADNNPSASRDLGLLVVEIGLAPTLPAEFITVCINLRASESSAT